MTQKIDNIDNISNRVVGPYKYKKCDRFSFGKGPKYCEINKQNRDNFSI